MNRHEVSLSGVVAVALASSIIFAAVPAAAVDPADQHCALVYISNYDVQTDQDLQLVVKRPGTDRTYEVTVDTNGAASVCLEQVWGVSDIQDDEPVSVRLSWSNAAQTTEAWVDVDMSGSPLPSYKIGAAGPAPVTWGVKKKTNALIVGDMGVDAASTDLVATGIPSWNPTRVYDSNSPWVIASSYHGISSNSATFGVWYNLPMRDLRDAQIDADKVWKVYVYYELTGSATASLNNGGSAQNTGKHNWDSWQSAVIVPPPEHNPEIYEVSGEAPLDPGMSFSVPNPTKGANWKCDFPNALGRCVGPAVAPQTVSILLVIKTTTKQSDDQGAFEFIVDPDPNNPPTWDVTSGAHDQVHLAWTCSLPCT